MAWDSIAEDWNALALRTPSPFLTHEWLSAWWVAFGRGRRLTVLVRDPSGALVAGALLARGPFGGVYAPVNGHSGEWDVVARDDGARDELWNRIVALDAPVTMFGRLKDDRPARAALVAAGRRIHESHEPSSPYLALPRTFDELLRSRSRKLRSQVGNSRRRLERQGRVRFRMTSGGARLEADLDAFLRVEASGWKARNGTAILSAPHVERLYRDFARGAAERGWLRLYLLELDGTPIAGNLGCAIEGCGFSIRSGFDEVHAAYSPGLIVGAEVLSASIEEGMREYDFLGAPDPHKLRWTSELRPRTNLRGFRGAAGLPSEAYRRALRPMLKRGRDRIQQLRS